jgi:YD repeat-containing protein
MTVNTNTKATKGSDRPYHSALLRKLACVVALGLGGLVAHQAWAQACTILEYVNQNGIIGDVPFLPGTYEAPMVAYYSQPNTYYDIDYSFSITSDGCVGVNTLGAVCNVGGTEIGTNAGGFFSAGVASLPFQVVSVAAPGSSCPEYWVTSTPPAKAQTSSHDPVGEPINPAIGNVYATEQDVAFAGSGSIAFKRSYNSADGTGVDGVMGWRHSYDRYINTLYSATASIYTGSSTTISPQYATPSAACTTGFTAIQSSVNAWTGAATTYSNGVCSITKNSVTIATLPIQLYPVPLPPPTPIEYDVIRDDGQTLRFPIQGNGAIGNPPGVSLRLATTGSGFTLTDDDDNVETYNTAGVLQTITSRAGVVQTISYTNGLWSGVTDSFGHSLTVTRNTNGNISSIAVNGGGTVQYSYDNFQRLSTVTNLDGTTRSYAYGNPGFLNALTAVVDESGTTLSSWVYDSQERATSTTQAVGANAMSLTYNSNGSVTTTDALGAVRTFTYTRVGDANQTTSISGSQCPTCQDSAATTYDSYGWVSSRTDYNGNLTCYANDPTRGVELVRVEGFAPGSTCPSGLSSYTPASGALQRKITTTWSSTWREPSLITEPNRTTAFTFDGSGNVLTKTVTDLTVSPNVSRTWTYTYNGYGQVLTAKGPRTDVNSTTTYTYYSCSSGTQCGQVQTITNAVGQVTTFNTYIAYGQPLTITDPNGVLTTLTYDARERITSSEVGTETTGYSYYPTGLLKTVTFPDSSTVTYTYDGAHRLTTVTDGTGNYISYTLDALGSHTADNSYDPSGTLHRAHTRVFNTLSELYQDVNSAGTVAVTTTYTYDAQGNRTAIDAPLSRNTGQAFDALNRLDKITDPNTGITQLSYDANDNLASVTDPRSLVTNYSHNGFNDVTQVVSPDSGTTVKTYDSGGNLYTSTDARGAVGTFSYDALNRLTQVAYGDETIGFTYDSGTNGNGRLTGASDTNLSMAWAYDTHGRVTGKAQKIGTITRTVGYSYTNGDMTTMVTPAGQTLAYTYTNHQITAITWNGTTILSGVTYDPFGPATGWTWGNSTSVSHTYTEDGSIASITSAADTINFSEDNASRITGITDTGASAYSWTIGYDVLDRVTSGVQTATTYGWTYDANGNRLTQTGTSASMFTPSTTSNQLNSTTGSLARTYSYDAAGNTTGYGTSSLVYNNRGRVVSDTVGTVPNTFTYNPLGQLAEYYYYGSGEAASTTITMMYDEAGHLIGQYYPDGTVMREYVWMGDIPVAELINTSAGIVVYYVHSDQLNAPRKVTRPSDNALMWRWDPNPFGVGTANQNPAGMGTFYNDLRFPGQILESGTTFYSNGFRDYDPQTGKYIEIRSDWSQGRQLLDVQLRREQSYFTGSIDWGWRALRVWAVTRRRQSAPPRRAATILGTTSSPVPAETLTHVLHNMSPRAIVFWGN